MTPSIYPQLVNDRFGASALYVDLKFERRTILVDLGNLHGLPPKKILRVSDIFVSHTHIDHFIGFDQVLRVLLGRERDVRIVGPAGIIDRVEHKLGGYSRNLVDRFLTDLAFHVTELHEGGETERATFRLKEAFRRTDESQTKLTPDVFQEDAMFKFRAGVLDHDIPYLSFAIEERVHVNVSEPDLAALDLAVGPWLRDLKHAVLTDKPDDTVIQTVTVTGGKRRGLPLGMLRETVLTVTRCQKIAYVVDVRDTPSSAGGSTWQTVRTLG